MSKADLRVNVDSRVSRRRLLQRGGAGIAAGTLAITGGDLIAARAQEATPLAADDLMAAIKQILADPRYRPSRLGVLAIDAKTGETVVERNADEWFLAASTTKLFSGSAALDALGGDFRFETPVYRTGGELDADGTLHGNLILVASGDLTMGGRNTPEGTIAYTPIDHINATAFPALVTLTPEDPLAGLDDLAKQVAAAGIKTVEGQVLIDDRLFPAVPKDGYILSPVWINDNLIDLTLTPGPIGEMAAVVWRPMSAAYTVESAVKTVATGEPASFNVTSPSPGQIVVEGQIPADITQAIPTYQIEDPTEWARTLFIEALERAGLTVLTKPASTDATEQLPDITEYAAAEQVAVLKSLPFSENLKLIMKTSHNQHADMLIFLLALQQGKTDYDDGMPLVQTVLEKAGIDPGAVSLSDGRGNAYTDLVSPRAVAHLLAYLQTRPDFQEMYHALPILGVDGTEATTVPPDSPVAGKAVGKSGMTVDGDVMNQRPVTMTRALAGYMTAASGRELIYTVYLNNVPMASLDDALTVITDHGKIVEAIYERF